VYSEMESTLLHVLATSLVQLGLPGSQLILPNSDLEDEVSGLPGSMYEEMQKFPGTTLVTCTMSTLSPAY
jgi:hypothetical protein